MLISCLVYTNVQPSYTLRRRGELRAASHNPISSQRQVSIAELVLVVKISIYTLHIFSFQKIQKASVFKPGPYFPHLFASK